MRHRTQASATDADHSVLMRNSPFAWLVRSIAWLAGIGSLAFLIASGATTPIDNALYDLHLRHWQFIPNDNTVIVAIDLKSMSALGSWPWRRAIHAKLIDQLTAYGVRGIGMNITMSATENDSPGDDLKLAEAIRRNGKVVLPVFAEADNLGGPLQEVMPAPIIAQNVAALGHVDVPKDADGQTRSAYLRAGLGGPHWLALGLALNQLDANDKTASLPGLRNEDSEASPYLWLRDNYVLLRYADSERRFAHVSYLDVLDGVVPTSLLKGRRILVGVTTEGLGDAIQTPVARMPGVAYQANILEDFQRNMFITPVNFFAQLVIGGCVLTVPLLLFGLPGFRKILPVLLASCCLVLFVCIGLLRILYIWWPPTAALVVILIGLAAWTLTLRHGRR